MFRRFLYGLAITALMGFPASAKITLPGIFSSNMVLQQQTNAAIWGGASPGAMVTVTASWPTAKPVQVRADGNGSWKVKIATPKAGGPYTVSVSDGQKITLNNVLIGEVWFCSGQSNMEMALRGNSSPVLNSAEIILNADNPQLRLYEVPRAASATPLSQLKPEWMESTSATAREFSALAFQFGQILQKKLHVPVGVIVSSVGGTMIESWMSPASLAVFPEVKVLPSLDTVKAPLKANAALFNAMVEPVIGYGIRGFTWYQGESNRHEPELYARLFPAMVADWRKRWNSGDLPFYYVEIAPLTLKDKTRSGTRIREVQAKAMNTIPNSGMAPSIDVGMETDIHPMDKTTLAQRLSYWALGNTYGIKGIQFRQPVLKSWTAADRKVTLTFDNAPYLTSYKKELTLFEVAGDDRKFYPAKADIRANQVIVESELVKKPVAVRYAWREWVKGELFNNDGLPLSSFKTDDWP